MEDCHRKIIMDNLDILVQYTNYPELIKACVRQNIISPIMMKNIENIQDADEKKKHRALFIKLTKRGPEAYDKIHETLTKLEYYDAAKILRTGEYSGFKSLKDKNIMIRKRDQTPPPTLYNLILNDGCVYSTKDTTDKIDKNDNGDLKIYDKDVPKKFDVKKSNKLYVDGKIEIYPMQKKENRGVLFMVNIIDFPHSNSEKDRRRNGAEIDRDNMIHLFREFGFKIFYYENKTLNEFHMLLDKLLQSQHVKETECFILALMTHGTMENGIEHAEFYDGSVVNLTVILDKFHNNVCPNLVRKPKILFFPFCRGTVSDLGTYSCKPKKVIESDGMDIKLPRSLPTYSDMLICYASVPGFKVHRDPEEGSWYIQKLCEVFAKYAHDTHIEDMLKIIGEETGKIRTDDGELQTASFINYGFHKKLYFNPGYYNS